METSVLKLKTADHFLETVENFEISVVLDEILLLLRSQQKQTDPDL